MHLGLKQVPGAAGDLIKLSIMVWQNKRDMLALTGKVRGAPAGSIRAILCGKSR